MSFRSLLIAGVSLLVASCSNDKKQSNGPIVLGDSTTIVTETDPKYLNDFVDDIQLRTIPEDTVTDENSGDLPAQDTVANNTTVTSTPQEQTPSAPQENGLNIPFKEVTVFIPEIQTKTYRQQNLAAANGATYQLVNGNLNGSELQLNGGTITKVSQRYITSVVAKSELGTLTLDALSNTTDWKPLKGNGKTYTIAGLDRPQAKNATPAQIRAAVSRAARSKRMSRQNIQKWEKALRNVRSVNQAPLKAVLRSVMWKIEGKDASGKTFQKQVRIDLPI